MKNQVKAKMDKILSDMTVEVKVRGLKKFRLRLWIARQLFRLGAKIATFHLKFEVN